MPKPDANWPVEIRGVTESIVTTLGPNGLYNVAALGLFSRPDGSSESDDDVRARTWGRTRTWRNFTERGEGYVQFTRDPVDFVEATATIREEPDPLLESADAWVQVSVDPIAEGTEDGTQWVEWAILPVEEGVERRVVPTTNRGYYAVVEATVAASRLGVSGYDDDTLCDRLAYFEEVVERCGGAREREAFDRLREHVKW